VVIEDARELLTRLRDDNPEGYVDAIWSMRYPQPSPKSGKGWPCRVYENRSSAKKIPHNFRVFLNDTL